MAEIDELGEENGANGREGDRHCDDLAYGYQAGGKLLGQKHNSNGAVLGVLRAPVCPF